MVNYYEYRLYKPYKDDLYDKIKKLRLNNGHIIFLDKSKYILLTPILFRLVIKRYGIQRKILSYNNIKNLILLLPKEDWNYVIRSTSDLTTRIKELESQYDDDKLLLNETLQLIKDRLDIDEKDEKDLFLYINVEFTNITLAGHITIKSAISIDVENKFFEAKNKDFLSEFISSLDETLSE